MKKSTQSGRLVLGFLTATLAICYALDAFDVWGKINHSNLPLHFACGVQPYTSLVSQIMPSALTQTAIAECTNVPSEAAISFIFLCLKLTLSLVMPLLMIGCMFLRNHKFLRERYDFRSDQMKEHGSTMMALIATGTLFALCMFVASYAAMFTVVKSGDLSQLPTGFTSKVIFENNAAMFSFLGMMFVVFQIVAVIANVRYGSHARKDH